LGGVLGLVAVYLRRWLQETPVFEALKTRRSAAPVLPIKVVLLKHPRAVFLSAALTWMLAAIVIVVALMAPTLMQKLYGVPPLVTLFASDIGILGTAVSTIVTGALIDRIGARRVAAVLGPILIVAVYALFSKAAANPPYLLGFSLLAGLSAGLIALAPVAMVKAFPASVRFTGVSFSYNTAYALAGGLTPVLVQAWVLKDRLGPAHYVAACTIIGLLATFINGATNRLPSPETARASRSDQ
jgi:predicted MFS family arabinose efflux permease